MPRKHAQRAGLVDVTDLLSYKVLQLSNTLARWAAREYRRRFDVTLPEWRVISAVGVLGPISVNEVARAIIVDKAMISRTLESLVSRGIVEKIPDPHHGRRSLLTLSSRGRGIHARVSLAALERQERLLSVLSARDREALEKLLGKLQRQADVLLGE